VTVSIPRTCLAESINEIVVDQHSQEERNVPWFVRKTCVLVENNKEPEYAIVHILIAALAAKANKDGNA